MGVQSKGASDVEADDEAGQSSDAGNGDKAASPEPDESWDLLDESLITESVGDAAARTGESPSELPADEVTTALRNLEVQVQEFHGRAANYEQIIRQMQTRIEHLQGDQIQALLKPVIQRFAGLHAQAIEACGHARDRGEAAEKDFSFFAVAIEEALGLVDIESVQAAPSTEFDRRKHHVARVVATDVQELDGRIQRVLRQGFTYVDAPRVFIPAQVSVYRYEPPQAPAEAEPLENDPKNKHGEGDLGE
ncbi:hypothetical protein ARTSIC4J27_985 [Pseudarthrobacter siccitolerans]|uniref:Nucleotide exchange factor GrpE n=1 Tax=Pseudarthrobacter siccitolerans TaxID=861266 RepID=A0A024GZL9_9MICC|nr:nucleotide exchange factor GrpE [Pseudarthrobacter siccitolerans]CCQ45052.1 hypothetical protein ARTSIC4J27_985 [Pseudarthrobacter siccitolerans]